MNTQWWKKSVVYQIYPRSFCDSNGDGIGDLNGVTQKLDYLKELGVDVIWLSPIYQSPNDDNGYDISDYQAIMQEFGCMEDFDRLLAQAHERGLRIVLDLVVNHTSDEHVWFAESRKSKDNPYRDYYIWKPGKNGKEPNNWGSWFFNSAWKLDEITGEYYLHIFSKKQPDLNWDNPKVRHDVYDMMHWWLDKGVDGFRMDVISLISKQADFPDGAVCGECGKYGSLTPFCEHGPNVHSYLQEMNREVLSRYDIMTVGETPNGTLEEATRYTNADGTELNMVFQFEHVMLDHGPYGKYSASPFHLNQFKQVMTKWQNGLYEIGWNSLYLENHDQPRSVTRFGNDSSREYWEKSAKMLAVCLHMMQGTPYIYQGQEIGMTNIQLTSIEEYCDIEARNAYIDLVQTQKLISNQEFMRSMHLLSRDNARTPMQWDSSTNAGFTSGTPWFAINKNYTEVNVASQLQDENSVFQFYRKLISLRKQNDIIINGKYVLTENTDERLYVYERIGEAEKLLVICNFSNQNVAFAPSEEYAVAEVWLKNYPDAPAAANLTLRPYEAIVYHLTQ